MIIVGNSSSANGTYQLQMCTSVSGMVNGGLK